MKKKNYSDLTTSNKSFIKKFSHSKRFLTAIKILNFKSNDKFLDIGTGDGYLLKLVSRKKIQKIIGYEPNSKMFKELKKNFYNKKDIILKQNIENESNSFTKISCLEVLEHLGLKDQNKIFKIIKKNSTNSSIILIGVPIETGLSGFIKNLIRILLKQTHENTSFINVFKSLFNFKIQRKKSKYIDSHIGFDFNTVEKLILSNNFKILKKYYSPFNCFGIWLNSQIYWLIKKNN